MTTKNKTTKTNKPAKQPKTAPVTQIFGLNVCELARALGKAGFKPSEAVNAICAKIPTASRSCLAHHCAVGGGLLPIPTLKANEVAQMRKLAKAA